MCSIYRLAEDMLTLPFALKASVVNDHGNTAVCPSDCENILKTHMFATCSKGWRIR